MTLAEAGPFPAPAWWRRPSLDAIDGRLVMNGVDLESLVRELGAPLFVYDLGAPVENMRRLQAALASTGRPVPAPVRAQGEPGSGDARRLPRPRRPGRPGGRSASTRARPAR